MLAFRTVARSFAAARANFYQTLGVSPSASADDIKAAYKALVKKYHPDVAGPSASEEKFREVTEAYTVLSNLETRVKYDLLTTNEVAKVLNAKKEGVAPATTNFAPHEHGYQRLKELAEERKKFNLDKYYRFRGGVPRANTGGVRGTAEGRPGVRAQTSQLNSRLKGVAWLSPQADYVDQFAAEQFKTMKRTDEDLLTKKTPYLPVEMDYEFHKGGQTKKALLFWLGFWGFLSAVYFVDELPKFQNRLKIAELLATKDERLKPIGMRAVSLP